VNAGKYTASIICPIIVYSIAEKHGYFDETFKISFKIFATLYSFVWDITMDWGLARKLFSKG